MRRWAAFLLVLASCRQRPTPATVDAAPAPETKATAAAPASSAPAEDTVTAVVRRWNEAHAKRDATALEALYADSVSHYGTKMSRAAVVKAKAAAFAAAPDFTQSVGKVDVEPGLNAGQRLARFTKTVTQKGKTKDFPAALVVRGDRIEEENDDTDWCRSGDGSGTNDRVVPPFTLSGSEAVRRAYLTNHMKDEQKARPGLIIDVRFLSCPKVCPKPSYECGYNVRTSDLDAKTVSNLVEWLYIDPVEKKLWFDTPNGWRSEPLPATN